MKLLVYSDGRPSSARALRFAARLTRSLDAEMAVMTVRSGTHATEPPPPIGQDVDLSEPQHLPAGLQIMANALEVLSEEGLLDRPEAVRLSELPNGHLFVCQSRSGKRIPFYVCFGPMIETLNHEIDKHRYDLLAIAPPQRGKLHKMVLGDTTRKLVIDLHTSLLFVRGGGADSRIVACLDGSPAAGRQLPMLKRLLPAITHPIELVWVKTPEQDAAGVQTADQFLRSAARWIEGAGHRHSIIQLEGENPAESISAAAGDNALILIGGSLRHDIYRRLRGSLAIQILARTGSSVLVVKGLPEGDPDSY